MGRYALLVAASDYEDPYFAQLRSPAQDVRALAGLLRDPLIGGFEVTVLENAADHEIRRALEDLVSDRQGDDLVLVYFSCHGLQDIHGRLHFATTGTRAARPASTAVPAAFVSDQLEHTLAGGRLLLLDCCYSGAFARGFAKSSPRPLDGEIGGSRGYVCLTACNEYELAYEGDHVVLDRPTPSHFTEAVIEGLRTGAADLDGDGWVETGELYKYAYDTVRRSGRQTPSYFATGLQKEIRVARVPGETGQVLPVAISATVASRTPTFFAPRFPPFHFARENRVTPTALAEAMAGRPGAAADLFASREERGALYDWIDHDVGDRRLERSILRKPPRDHAAAEAAAATFIATFAPHLHPAFRGWRANVAGLTAAATAAVEGHSEAAAMVADLYHHNVLRTLSRHDCSDHDHACGSGNACGVLQAAASRWDGVLPSARAAMDEVPSGVRPAEEAVAAQLLLMILDPVGRELPPHRDMPSWWLRLVLDARITADGGDARFGPLAVAALTCRAAMAERDATRLTLLAGTVPGRAEPAAEHTAKTGRLRRWSLIAASILVLSGVAAAATMRTGTDQVAPAPAARTEAPACPVDELQGDSAVTLIWTDQPPGGCGAANVFVNNLPTGPWQLPEGSVRRAGDPRWIAGDTAVVSLWRPASGSWQLAGVPAHTPQTGRWTTEVRATRSGSDELKAIRRRDLLVVEAKSGAYLVDLRTGRERPAGKCAEDKPFGGLGPAVPGRVSIICGDALIPVTD